MPPLPPVTKFLMLLCTAVFCVQLLVPAVPLHAWFALWPLRSGNFLPWQPLTYALLHGDFLHLFFNMFALWSFGSELERLWGDKRYLQFLAASTITAALAQLAVTAVTGSLGPTLGISGGVFGLLLAFGMLFPNRTLMLIIPPMPIKAKYYVIVFGLFELYAGVRSSDSIAHFAHLGGMLGGYLMILYWRGRPPFGGRRGPRRLH